MADFASSRGQGDVLDIREFTQWLATHGHAELKEMIEKSHNTSISIKAALSEGKDELLDKLARIEGLLAAVTIGEGALDDLAVALRPESVLSAQSRAILVAYETVKAGQALESHMLDGTFLHFIDGNGNSTYTPDDPRFLADDLDTLLERGMLSLSHNGRGDRIFQLTRRGASVAQSIQAQLARPF
jgi:hypothetical protein